MLPLSLVFPGCQSGFARASSGVGPVAHVVWLAVVFFLWCRAKRRRGIEPLVAPVIARGLVKLEGWRAPRSGGTEVAGSSRA